MSIKPNILLLYSDQHNARCLSYAGHPDVKTPHLDTIAGQGIQFTNAYTQNPVCTPSRMSMLTSLYPSTFGYYGLYGREPDIRMTSMCGYFRQQGYRTGIAGKLHTPRYWLEQDCQFAYDEFIEYPKYLEALGLYERNDSRNFAGVSEMTPRSSAIPLEHSAEVAAAKQALRFIRNEGEPKDRGASQEPWFLWLTFSRPHQPCTPSAPFDRMYDQKTIELPCRTKPKNIQAGNPSQAGNTLNEKQLRNWLSAYYGVVSQVDHAVGIVFEALKHSGQLDNTIILYMSDHGDYAGEHFRMEKNGGISFRAITRIPLIFRVPDGLKGQTCTEIVEAVDIFPTLCDLIGIESPASVQGESILPMLNDPTRSIRNSALTENPYRKALATKSWRYVANLPEQGEVDELYDLEHDPWETENKINDPACSDIVQEMQRRLFARLVRARRPVTVLNGQWHDHRYDNDGRVDLRTCGDITPYW